MTDRVTVSEQRHHRLFRKHANLFLIEGIVLVVLGLLAVLVPVIATLALTILPWLAVPDRRRGWARNLAVGTAGAGVLVGVISAILSIVAGLILIASPVHGALSLTFVLIAFFLLEGIVTILYALEHRAELPGKWGFMLVSGIVTLLLASMIFMGLPATADWAIGLLVGIDMIFGGAALISMAMAVRRAV